MVYNPDEVEIEMDTNQLEKEIYKLIDLKPIQIDDKVGELSKLSGKKPKRILEQLEVFKKDFKDKDKKIIKQAGDELTQKQFYILRKRCTNDRILGFIEEGLDFINLNPLIRSECRMWLEKILDERRLDATLKEKVLSLLHRKEFGEATELLVDEIEKNNYIYTTKTDKMPEIYIYNEGIYCDNGKTEIEEQLRNIMEENYSEWIANQVLSKIKADTGIAPELFFKENDRYEVPLRNGILDLEKIELKEFNSSKIFFSKMPITYDETKTCPKIEQFLQDVLSSPDDINVFYELAGFGLSKEYFMEKAFMMVGNGRNGKGKTLELLKRMVGFSNCSSVPLAAITSESPFVERLWKRFFNLAGDISSKDLKETGMFKQLTGRDPISANRKYKNVVEFTNYAKMVFACNDLPRVYDYSDGFWERWVLLEFPYKFVDQDVFDNATKEEKKQWKIKDPLIIDKITTDDEMSGLLNMAITGFHRLLNNKRFSYSKGTSEVKNKWIRKADSFMAFSMDCLEDDYDSRISKKELRKLYKDYCSLHKVSGVSDKSIKSTLQENFGASEEYRTIEFNGPQEHCWTGIKVKENA